MSKEVMERLQNLPDEECVIVFDHVTKDYGNGRGIFDISFKIPKGCTFGYCGTNGAGKTTTLRHIMGFIKPDKGKVTVEGKNPWKEGESIKNRMGYLPGEIAFPPVESGSDFLKSQAELIDLTDMSKAEKIINAMQLDPTANLKRMSKGMKQKTAIVATFMHSPDIILLDEPTTGLDPLMREAFIEIVMEEKARGATIMMSNHMFDELDETCDYVGFIKDGHLVDIVDMNELHNRPYREFFIFFYEKEDLEKFKKTNFEIRGIDENLLGGLVKIDKNNAQKFLDFITTIKLKQLTELKYSLERYFMENIGGKEYGINDAKEEK